MRFLANESTAVSYVDVTTKQWLLLLGHDMQPMIGVQVYPELPRSYWVKQARQETGKDIELEQVPAPFHGVYRHFKPAVVAALQCEVLLAHLRFYQLLLCNITSRESCSVFLSRRLPRMSFLDMVSDLPFHIIVVIKLICIAFPFKETTPSQQWGGMKATSCFVWPFHLYFKSLTKLLWTHMSLMVQFAPQRGMCTCVKGCFWKTNQELIQLIV